LGFNYRQPEAGGCADPGTVGGGVRTDFGQGRRSADYFWTAAAAFGGVVTT